MSDPSEPKPLPARHDPSKFDYAKCPHFTGWLKGKPVYNWTPILHRYIELSRRGLTVAAIADSLFIKQGTAKPQFSAFNKAAVTLGNGDTQAGFDRLLSLPWPLTKKQTPTEEYPAQDENHGETPQRHQDPQAGPPTRPHTTKAQEGTRQEKNFSSTPPDGLTEEELASFVNSQKTDTSEIVKKLTVEEMYEEARGGAWEIVKKSIAGVHKIDPKRVELAHKIIGPDLKRMADGTEGESGPYENMDDGELAERTLETAARKLDPDKFNSKICAILEERGYAIITPKEISGRVPSIPASKDHAIQEAANTGTHLANASAVPSSPLKNNDPPPPP